MNVKALRHTHEPIGDFCQLFPRQTGSDFIFRFVAAVVISRPVFR